jgi:hypothetical protein
MSEYDLFQFKNELIYEVDSSSRYLTSEEDELIKTCDAAMFKDQTHTFGGIVLLASSGGLDLYIRSEDGRAAR